MAGQQASRNLDPNMVRVIKQAVYTWKIIVREISHPL